MTWGYEERKQCGVEGCERLTAHMRKGRWRGVCQGHLKARKRATKQIKQRMQIAVTPQQTYKG